MAVAGLFGLGIPLADMLLGTYKMPCMVLEDQALVISEDLAQPIPSRFVELHDHWAQTRFRRLQREFHTKLANRSVNS